MTMTDYQQAKALIVANPDLADFVGPRPDDMVREAEAALGVQFPAAYRCFLRDFGAGSFGSFEVYGLIDDRFKDSGVPNGIWYTLAERRDANLPSDLVIVAEPGTGDLYCLDLGTGQGSVVLVQPAEPAAREPIAPDFGAFLLEQIREELEVEGGDADAGEDQ